MGDACFLVYDASWLFVISVVSSFPLDESNAILKERAATATSTPIASKSCPTSNSVSSSSSTSVASLSSTGKFPLDESSEAANDKSEGKSPLKKNGKRNAKGTAHDTHNRQGTKRKFDAHEKETPNPKAMLNSVLSDTKDENQNLTGNHQQTQQKQQQERQRQQQKQQNHRN